MSEATTYEQYLEKAHTTPPPGISLKGQQQAVETTDTSNWQDLAACKGWPPESSPFYPPNHYERKFDRLEREERAKRVCGSCAVRQACLQFALNRREQFGVWGGLNERERGMVVARKSKQ